MDSAMANAWIVEYPELYHTHYCWDSFPVKLCTLDCYQRTISNTYIKTDTNVESQTQQYEDCIHQNVTCIAKISHLWEEQKFKIKQIQNTELYYFHWLWITVQVFEIHTA
jgi:hypothetical protein